MKKYPQYKTAKNEVISDIPVSWELNKLKFLVKGKLEYGANESAELDDKSLPRYIRITDFGENGKIRDNTFKSLSLEKAKGFYLEEGDILFARSGATVGKTFQFKNYNGLACFAGYLIKASPLKEVILSDFLYYVTKSNYYSNWKSSIFIQATIQNIGADKYSLLEIPVPPMEEQIKIQLYLDFKIKQIDTLIFKKQKLIDLLKEQRTAIINHAVTKGIDPNVEMKDSRIEWLGKIPVNWNVEKVKYLFNHVKNPAPHGNSEKLISLYTETGVDLRENLEGRGNKSTTTDNYWFVKKEDIIVNKLLAWMGAIGISEFEGVTSPAYDVLRVINSKTTNPYYYNYLFRLKNMNLEFKRYSKGIMEMRLRLYFNQLGLISIPFPPLKVQNEIIDYINKETNRIDFACVKIQKEIDLLQEYRIALISEVVTGKIDVRQEVLS